MQDDEYVPIPLTDGRMPSQVIALHLEPAGDQLRLYDPETGQWLSTPDERTDLERERAELERGRAELDSLGQKTRSE